MTEKKNKEPLFKKFMRVDVSKHTYKKPANRAGTVQLSYMSWPWAYAYMRSFDEDSRLKFVQYPEYDFKAHHLTGRKLNYMNTGNGCYVTCKITIKNETRMQSLPVMDYKNQSIQNPDPVDINKAQKRCFVKCLAMFGLGLSLYGMKNITQYTGSTRSNRPRKRYQNRNNPQAAKAALEKKPISQKQINYVCGLTDSVDSTKLNKVQAECYNWAIQKNFKGANAYMASWTINQLSKAPKKQKPASKKTPKTKTKDSKQTTLLK